MQFPYTLLLDYQEHSSNAVVQCQFPRSLLTPNFLKVALISLDHAKNFLHQLLQKH